MPTVEFERVFQAAHRLPDYDGKCARIHGHNFHLRVSITVHDLDEQGFVVEFEKVKSIIDAFDHRLILSRDDPIKLGTPADWTILVPGPPTTEFMAQFFADQIAGMWPLGKTLVETELRETDSIMAKGRSPERVEVIA